jgi:predicted restriction endonuclease
VGQGRFRANVQGVERACRVTKVERPEHLIASHTKPWRDSTNDERLDGENGLLLTPTIDHLFDKGFISFEDNGLLIASPVADRASLVKMGIDPKGKMNVGVFSEGQRRFLEYHRENVLRMSRRS